MAEMSVPVPLSGNGRETVEQQARRRGIRPVASVEEMSRSDGFGSDEELDAFLAHLYAERHANLA
jgi:hypothetical protein